MNRSYLFFTLSLILALMVGCSSGPGNPAAPSPDPDVQEPALTGSAQTENPETSSGHAMMGYWDVLVSEDGEVEFVPLRSSTLHFNMVPILEAGTMKLGLASPPWVTDGVLHVDISLEHPFVGNDKLSGFDVKGIVITNGSQVGYADPDIRIAGPGETRLLNADGFTRWWNPAEFLNTGITGYNQGALGTYIDPATTSILNGYKLFADGFGVNDSLDTLDPASRAFFQAGNLNARHYDISLASGLVFNYAVDCSWAAPTVNPPLNLPDDFPIEANQAEPWFFEVTENYNTLWYEGGNFGGNVSFQIVVHDWQGVADLGTLHIESPGLFDFSASDPVSSTEFTATYEYEAVLPELGSAAPINVLFTMEIPGSYDTALTGVDKLLRGYHRHISQVSSVNPVFNQPPVALMHATTETDIWTDETVSFDATASYDTDGFITQYLWDFNGDGVYGDPFDGDPETPTATYTIAGVYQAKVKVRDNATGSAVSDPVEITVTFDENDPPVAIAEATTPTDILEDNTISFDATASYDGDGSIIDKQWDFDGDGSYGDPYTGNENTPTALYADPGTFYVDVKVFDDGGAWDVLDEKIEVNIEDVPNVLPVAAAIATTTTEISPCGNVTFDASGSVDTDGTIEDYLWDFDGDGVYGDSYESGTLLNPTKVYPVDGVFDVDLKIIDDEAAEDTLDVLITVTVTNILPVAHAVANTATEIYRTETVEYDATGSTDLDCDDIVLYEWDFNDDGVYGDPFDSGTDITPSLPYLELGTFNIWLKVTDGLGGEDETDEPIVVTVQNYPPVGCGEITTAWPYFWDSTLEFTATCASDPDGTITDWEWDLDADGTYEETGEAASYYFADVGDYQMQVRITDNDGESALLPEPIYFHVYDDSNWPPQINEVIHSRTTSEMGNDDEAVSLSVDVFDPVPADDTHTYLWSCDYGIFDDDTSETPIWYPPTEVIQCDITVRVTDEQGAWQDGTCNQWVTQWPILANNPNATDGTMIIPGSLEEALTSEIIDPASFKYPLEGPNGNVVYINIWATWCGYCVQEMPQLDTLFEMYNAGDYIHIHHDIGESKTTVVNWINSHEFDATYWTLDPTSAYWNLTRPWNGGSGGIPQHLVFDRDGRCRGARVGGIGSVGIEPIDKYLRELVPYG